MQLLDTVALAPVPLIGQNKLVPLLKCELDSSKAESLVIPNENLGSCKVDEIGAKSGQFMMKIRKSEKCE